MADYYTPTVIDPVIPITATLPIERLFLAAVFSQELTSADAYYYSDEGAADLIFLEAEAVRTALDGASAETGSLARKLLDEHREAVLGDQEIELDMCGELWPGVLQNIVRRSPDLDHLTVTMAFTCSKMGPDGFGGLAMMITADAVRSESMHTLFDRFYTEARANGEISHGNS